MNEEKVTCLVHPSEWGRDINKIKTECGHLLWLLDGNHTGRFQNVTCPKCQATEVWKEWYVKYTAVLLIGDGI
jgi:hypothetical protein